MRWNPLFFINFDFNFLTNLTASWFFSNPLTRIFGIEPINFLHFLCKSWLFCFPNSMLLDIRFYLISDKHSFPFGLHFFPDKSDIWHINLLKCSLANCYFSFFTCWTYSTSCIHSVSNQRKLRLMMSNNACYHSPIMDANFYW